MCPTEQCLETDDRLAVEPEDRLIVETEFPALKRRTQLDFQLPHQRPILGVSLGNPSMRCPARPGRRQRREGIGFLAFGDIRKRPGKSKRPTCAVPNCETTRQDPTIRV